MEKKALIMDESAIRRAVARITYEILERNRGAQSLCIVGILSRGVVLAERIAQKIYELEQVHVDFGALDITPYRDDRAGDQPAVFDDEKRVRVLNSLIAACGLVLLVLVLSMTLKKDAPAIAFLLTLTAGVLILLRAFALVGGTMQRFSGLLAQGGITQSLYLPVLKTVGVAVVVRIMSALCRDSGQSALAAKLEIMGAVLALSMCLPLLEQVLALVADWTI